MIQKLRWVSGNRETEFTTGEGAQYFFDPAEFDGGSASGEFEQYIIPHRDGIKTLSCRLAARQISFKVQINLRGNSEQAVEEFKSDFAEVFFPKKNGTLYRTVGTYQRQIVCTPRRTPLLTGRIGGILYYTVELTADDPYWLGELIECELGQSYSAGFPLYFGIGTSFIVPGATVTNNCAHDVYPVIEIFEPLKISNTTTGEYIEVTKTITSGQKLVVDTAEDSVTLWTLSNGVWTKTSDESNYITAASGILYLAPGANTLTVTRSGSSTSSAVRLSWRERFAGV